MLTEFLSELADAGFALTVLDNLSEQWFVYLLLDSSNLIYVGSSFHIYGRINQHHRGTRWTDRKGFSHIAVIACSSKVEALELERSLISLLEPKLNDRLTNKSPRKRYYKRSTQDTACIKCGKPTRSIYEICTRDKCRKAYRKERERQASKTISRMLKDPA